MNLIQCARYILFIKPFLEYPLSFVSCHRAVYPLRLFDCMTSTCFIYVSDCFFLGKWYCDFARDIVNKTNKKIYHTQRDQISLFNTDDLRRRWIYFYDKNLSLNQSCVLQNTFSCKILFSLYDTPLLFWYLTLLITLHHILSLLFRYPSP